MLTARHASLPMDGSDDIGIANDYDLFGMINDCDIFGTINDCDLFEFTLREFSRLYSLTSSSRESAKC
jgi:hypothetical protein